MDTRRFQCTRCEIEQLSGNATLPPKGWEWSGSSLLCADCLPAVAHRAASLPLNACPDRTHDSSSAVDDEPISTTVRAEPVEVRNPAQPAFTASKTRLFQATLIFATGKGMVESIVTIAAANAADACKVVEQTDHFKRLDLVSIIITPATLDCWAAAKPCPPMVHPIMPVAAHTTPHGLHTR